MDERLSGSLTCPHCSSLLFARVDSDVFGLSVTAAESPPIGFAAEGYFVECACCTKRVNLQVVRLTCGLPAFRVEPLAERSCFSEADSDASGGVASQLETA